jgi:hypothetical protein
VNEDAVSVTIVDTQTGERFTKTGSVYYWTDGNGSCDCNRAKEIVFHTACCGCRRYLITSVDPMPSGMNLSDFNDGYEMFSQDKISKEYRKSLIAAEERPDGYVVSATVPELLVAEPLEPKQLGANAYLQGDAVILRFTEKVDGIGLRPAEARALAEKLRKLSHEADAVAKGSKKR